MSLPTSEPGLYPNYLPLNGGLGSSREYSFGGLGDSFYEYLIKQWLFTGRTEHKFLKAHEDAISVSLASGAPCKTLGRLWC